jgi:hypothetical protein
VQGRTTPQRQRRAQQVRPFGEVAGSGGPVHQPAELVGVDIVGVGAEPVTAPVGAQHRPIGAGLLQHRADPRRVRLQGPAGLRRWVVVPEQVAQPVGGDHLVVLEQQDRQQGPFLPAWHGQRPTVPATHLDRAEHTEPHTTAL